MWSSSNQSCVAPPSVSTQIVIPCKHRCIAILGDRHQGSVPQELGKADQRMGMGEVNV